MQLTTLAPPDSSLVLLPRPAAPQPVSVKFQAVEASGTVFIGLNADNYFSFALWLEQLQLFIGELAGTVRGYERQVANDD